MIATLKYNSKNYKIDLAAPLDLSIAMKGDKTDVNAWYLPPATIKPHKEDGFVGSVAEGASINFNTITFNPHAHITHTETVGHITEKLVDVNKAFKKYFFLAEVITVAPEKINEDWVVSKKQLSYALRNKKREAVVIRTLPNTKAKKSRQYAHTNPPYLEEAAAAFLKKKGIQHLLVDLPSVDKEKDDGLLLCHNAFWNTKGKLREKATITEFIYVPNKVKDGTYFLNIQMAPMVNDATPSRPILYAILD
ncbi:cyclase family protein [Croceivirga sp. JEA036]|uniref:cyclase family protein n=1 Tax=Croceivirga sp. JEA036 TaxID=2721162 RepID=UPI00143A989A|nr:cyclase family protein [Croceivirga sp. JEA036]NJB36317.1 cyclase family protein [Croceivirga sp. JEA036]